METIEKKITSKSICWWCDHADCLYHKNRKRNPRHCRAFREAVKGRLCRKKFRQQEKKLCKELPEWRNR